MWAAHGNTDYWQIEKHTVVEENTGRQKAHERRQCKKGKGHLDMS